MNCIATRPDKTFYNCSEQGCDFVEKKRKAEWIRRQLTILFETVSESVWGTTKQQRNIIKLIFQRIPIYISAVCVLLCVVHVLRDSTAYFMFVSFTIATYDVGSFGSFVFGKVIKRGDFLFVLSTRLSGAAIFRHFVCVSVGWEIRIWNLPAFVSNALLNLHFRFFWGFARCLLFITSTDRWLNVRNDFVEWLARLPCSGRGSLILFTKEIFSSFSELLALKIKSQNGSWNIASSIIQHIEQEYDSKNTSICAFGLGTGGKAMQIRFNIQLSRLLRLVQWSEHAVRAHESSSSRNLHSTCWQWGWRHGRDLRWRLFRQRRLRQSVKHSRADLRTAPWRRWELWNCPDRFRCK